MERQRHAPSFSYHVVDINTVHFRDKLFGFNIFLTVRSLTAVSMSVSVDVNFQTQIVSVLDSLTKVAVVEITKLFECHFLAKGTTVLIEGRTEQNEILQTVDSVKKSGKKCLRSIGVQVDEELTAPKQCSVSKVSSEEGPAHHITMLEANQPADLKCYVLEHKDVEMVKGSCLEPESPTTTEPEGEQVIYSTPKYPNHLSGTVQSSPTKQKLQPLKTESENGMNTEWVTKVICQMVPKAEEQYSTPQANCKEKPIQVEPQQASVSTAKETAYSLSTSDGALAPEQAKRKLTSMGALDPPSAVKNKKVDFKLDQMMMKKVDFKLEQTSLEHKLTRACSVLLVNLLLVPGGKKANGSYCHNSKRFPMPKDLKTHQGIHTGRRLCCFTQCGNDVWRLQSVLSPSHSYGCKICGKSFKRRKILRRHERFHNGEKPYSCYQCSKMFALRKSLRRHERFHTGDKPHSCLQCGKSFRLRDNLKAHLRFHTGERPFTCSFCSKSFRILRNLEEHSVDHLGVTAK
ncbi:zinc finger protein 773-like [Oncorhynchus kisutch]|uniref:Zinc finger protein 773-like n=1 Tax=Oncorhynchus kisutch TaxID=8019 RepID=A0A8C7LGT2_ONCKI|nr:zinc finger protein 773-like [Oncorhynchus kisutch]